MERLLLPAATWNQHQAAFCARRQLPETADPFLDRVVDQIKVGLSAMDEAVAAGEVRIEDYGVHLKDDPALYSEPTSADELRQRLTRRVGRVQLPELLMAVDCDARFSWQLLGREPRSAEELVTVYAGVATAGHLDASTMALMIPGEALVHTPRDGVTRGRGCPAARERRDHRSPSGAPPRRRLG